MFQLTKAAKTLVALGDDPGIFMTCESGGERGYVIVMKCQSMEHLHAVHQALIDIVREARKIEDTYATESP